jgi:hypothetical protein
MVLIRSFLFGRIPRFSLFSKITKFFSLNIFIIN